MSNLLRARPPEVGESRVSEVAGRGAASGQTGLDPRGEDGASGPWDGPSLTTDVSAQATPTLLTMRGEEARPELAGSGAEGKRPRPLRLPAREQ